MSDEPLGVRLRRWAESYRHAANNRWYELHPGTARETATLLDRAADAVGGSAPAPWTEGPPTEPGEYWLALPFTGDVIYVEAFRDESGLLAYYQADGCGACRIVAIAWHTPAVPPEPPGPRTRGTDE